MWNSIMKLYEDVYKRQTYPCVSTAFFIFLTFLLYFFHIPHRSLISFFYPHPYSAGIYHTMPIFPDAQMVNFADGYPPSDDPIRGGLLYPAFDCSPFPQNAPDIHPHPAA